MAETDHLSHDVLGSCPRRVAPARAGRAAENIAYGYESFEKTLGQWIDSSGPRQNLLLRNASRVGIASARDASGKRTYWAMVIAGDYEPKPGKGKKDKEPVVAGKREAFSSGRRKPRAGTIRVLAFCFGGGAQKPKASPRRSDHVCATPGSGQSRIVEYDS